MLLTTTSVIEGKKIRAYLGVVAGEAIMGANIVRDIFASITDVVGGRSFAYESKLSDAREIALNEMAEKAARLGANAVVAIDLDYEVVREGMLSLLKLFDPVFLTLSGLGFLGFPGQHKILGRGR